MFLIRKLAFIHLIKIFHRIIKFFITLYSLLNTKQSFNKQLNKYSVIKKSTFLLTIVNSVAKYLMKRAQDVALLFLTNDAFLKIQFQLLLYNIKSA